MEIKKKRLELIDSIRGFAILSMIGFHACWIMSYFGLFIPHDMIYSTGFIIWERSICCTFIFISGFSFGLGRRQLKKGLIVLSLGVAITVLSVLFANDIRDVFGVLWILGLSPIITYPLDKILKEKMDDNKIISILFLIVSLLLLLIFWNINKGYLFLDNFGKIVLPRKLYRGYFMTFLGFLDPTFYSVDYFSLLPWIFLYFAGYFTNKIIKNSIFEETVLIKGIPFVKTIGKYSLPIYLIHPVVIFIICLLTVVIMKAI